MKAITANRLDDGSVVYLKDDDQWSPQISTAATFDDGDAKIICDAAQSRIREITDVYIIDVDSAGAPDGRAIIRETIRSAGPTVRQDLGYQAGAAK